MTEEETRYPTALPQLAAAIQTVLLVGFRKQSWALQQPSAGGFTNEMGVVTVP